MFATHAKRREITFATVRDLAAAFVTSLTATVIRLVELGSFPAMLVAHDRSHRRWFVRGPDVPEVLWPHDRVRPSTSAWDVLQGATVQGPIDVCADGWFGHRDAHRYAVREDAVLVSDGLVLSLIWWKDEQQLVDLEDDDEHD
jgi:hypothetical protein